MPTTPIPANLPARLDSATLAKYIQDGEPVIVAKFIGVGNTSPYDYRAKDNRAYVFRYDSKLEGHILRIPLRIWQGDGKKRPTDNLAHAMMDERRMPHPMVVTVEMPKEIVKAPLGASQLSSQGESDSSDPHNVASAGATPAPASTLIESPPEMGAADTTPAQNVVGLSDEPTVAPAVEAFPATKVEDWPVPTTEQVAVVEPPVLASILDSDLAPTVEDAGSVLLVRDVVKADATALCDLAFDLIEPPKRIKALAALLGVEEDALRVAIALPESKVELANAGWVRRKESTAA